MNDRGRIGVQQAGRPRLTVRGWGMCVCATAAFVAASIISNRDLLTLAILIAAMPISALAYIHVGRVSVEVIRSFSPEVVSVGSACEVAIEVRNLQQRGMASTLCRDENAVADDSPVLELPGLAGASRGSIEPRSRAVVRYTLTPSSRGIHPIGPLVVRMHDLLGLVYWDRAFGGMHSLAVVPQIIELDAEQLGGGGGAGGAVDVARLASTGGADNTLPREYRPGDAMRRVHWRATARHGDLMVRQDEQQNDPECWVVLDNRLRGHIAHMRKLGNDRGAFTSDSFEWAVAMAASIAVHAWKEGYLARIVHTARSGSGFTDSYSGREPESGHELLLNLAEAQLIGGRPEYDYISEVAGAARGGGVKPVYAVVGDIEEDEARELARLGQLCEPAIAFILDGKPGPQHVLEDAGWLCVPATAEDDLQEAWRTAADQNRSAHVGE